MFDTILFDLDGTLTNPFMGITGGIIYALERLGYDCPPREELTSFIGPPLCDEFPRRFNMDKAVVEEAVRLYRVYYAERGLYENELVGGAYELLAELKEKGKQICLATSKPLVFAEKILQYFKLDRFFDYIGAATMDGKIGTKGDVIRLVLENTGAEARRCLMVGDRFHDIVGAHEAGMKCAAVLVGFGSREEFAEYGADYICEALSEIAEIIRHK
ncbi:MAG: HAD-IA family hydrolase [Oscillospiraceae bacterium]|nr:HAD-IA family hydrolase [Oscillospiraceae bacterium]